MRMSLPVGVIPAAVAGVLLVIGIAGDIVPAKAQENPFVTGVDVRMGSKFFAASCGRCHGLNAKGNDESGAPDLTTGNFTKASTDADLFRVIHDGVPDTMMLGFSFVEDATIWQVIAYINSLNINPGDYDLPGNISNGQRIFNGKGNCTSCHMINGTGGRLGPDLSTVANRRKPDELRTDLTDPDETVEPRWWTMRVTSGDGSVLEGLRMNEDTFTLRVMDGDENLRHFSKGRIRSSERIEASSMPSVTGTLTTSEVDDLIAYLFSLRITRSNSELPGGDIRRDGS